VAAAAEPGSAAFEAEIFAGRIAAGSAFVGIRIALLAGQAITAVQPLPAGIADLPALGAEVLAAELGRDAAVCIAVASHAGGARAAVEVVPGARIMNRTAMGIARRVDRLARRQERRAQGARLAALPSFALNLWASAERAARGAASRSVTWRARITIA
jgi:hypothetical protein